MRRTTPELIGQINTRYYDYILDGEKAPPAMVIVRSHVVVKNPDSAPVVPAAGGYVSRRMAIRLRDLEAHGYTPGCPGCIGAQLGDGVGRDSRLTQ